MTINKEEASRLIKTASIPEIVATLLVMDSSPLIAKEPYSAGRQFLFDELSSRDGVDLANFIIEALSEIED